MGADVYYNISDVVKTITTVQDLNGSIRALLRNVLMNHMVKYEMDQIESHRYNIVRDVMVSFTVLYSILILKGWKTPETTGYLSITLGGSFYLS